MPESPVQEPLVSDKALSKELWDASGPALNRTEQSSVIPQDSTIATNDFETRHRAFLAAATSDNTRRTYRSAVRHFLTWGGALPCDEATVIRYLLFFSKTLNPRTLALRLTALSQWHIYQGFTDPASTPTVRMTLKGIERTLGRPKKKAKALPIDDLERIVALLSESASLKALRDNALLQIGYFGGFRRSELVKLDVQNLSWEADGLVITLPRSKTDQDGEGIVRAIPYGDEDVCPVKALRRWMKAADITEGAIFRSINKWGIVGKQSLHPSSVNTILEESAAHACLGYVPELSSHSLRRGMATSAHRAGADFRDIKRQGGWRHDGTVQGYIDEASYFENNATLKLLKRKAIHP
jgi:integrase